MKGCTMWDVANTRASILPATVLLVSVRIAGVLVIIILMVRIGRVPVAVLVIATTPRIVKVIIIVVVVTL